MQAFYLIPPNSNGSDNLTLYAPRAEALGLLPSFGSFLIPTVEVTSTAIATVNLPDDQQQVTLAQVQAAISAAQNAESAAAETIQQANQNLQTLVTDLQPALSQAQIDIQALQSSTDPNAQILLRTVEGVTQLAQAVADILTSLNIISKV